MRTAIILSFATLTSTLFYVFDVPESLLFPHVIISDIYFLFRVYPPSEEYSTPHKSVSESNGTNSFVLIATEKSSKTSYLKKLFHHPGGFVHVVL